MSIALPARCSPSAGSSQPPCHSPSSSLRPFSSSSISLACFELAADLRSGRARLVDVGLYLLGASLPILVFVAPLFLVGEQDAFIKGYLGLGAGYAPERSTAIFVFQRVQVAVILVLMTLALRQFRDPSARRQCRADLLLLSLGLWPAVALAIWLPGREFHHYLLYALIGLPLSVALAQYSFPPAPAPNTWVVWRLVAMALAVIVACNAVTFRVLNWRDTIKVIEMNRAFAPVGSGRIHAPSWPGPARARTTPSSCGVGRPSSRPTRECGRPIAPRLANI